MFPPVAVCGPVIQCPHDVPSVWDRSQSLSRLSCVKKYVECVDNNNNNDDDDNLIVVVVVVVVVVIINDNEEEENDDDDDDNNNK